MAVNETIDALIGAEMAKVVGQLANELNVLVRDFRLLKPTEKLAQVDAAFDRIYHLSDEVMDKVDRLRAESLISFETAETIRRMIISTTRLAEKAMR